MRNHILLFLLTNETYEEPNSLTSLGHETDEESILLFILLPQKLIRNAVFSFLCEQKRWGIKFSYFTMNESNKESNFLVWLWHDTDKESFIFLLLFHYHKNW